MKEVRQRDGERDGGRDLYIERVMHLFINRERESPTKLKIREARKRRRLE